MGAINKKGKWKIASLIYTKLRKSLLYQMSFLVSHFDDVSAGAVAEVAQGLQLGYRRGILLTVCTQIQSQLAYTYIISIF